MELSLICNVLEVCKWTGNSGQSSELWWWCTIPIVVFWRLHLHRWHRSDCWLSGIRAGSHGLMGSRLDSVLLWVRVLLQGDLEVLVGFQQSSSGLNLLHTIFHLASLWQFPFLTPYVQVWKVWVARYHLLLDLVVISWAATCSLGWGVSDFQQGNVWISVGLDAFAEHGLCSFNSSFSLAISIGMVRRVIVENHVPRDDVGRLSAN